MISGVYQVEHVTSGRRYIGSSANISRRLKRHASRLRTGKHPNPALQNMWNAYGESQFRFSTLVICRPCDLVLFEQAAIDAFASNKKENGFNVRLAAESNLGMPSSTQSHRTGDVYNRLTLIEPVEGPGLGGRWRCACSCGRETVARAAAVRRGLIRSCGCVKTEMLQASRAHMPGEKYGRLTLVKPDGRSASGCIVWLCACDCGGKKRSTVSHISRGLTRSCGCLISEGASVRAIARNAARRKAP